MTLFYQSFLGLVEQPVASRERAESLMGILRKAGGHNFRVCQDGRGWIYEDGRGWT